MSTIFDQSTRSRSGQCPEPGCSNRAEVVVQVRLIEGIGQTKKGVRTKTRSSIYCYNHGLEKVQAMAALIRREF